jgi:uncharacterized membrane protein YccC
VPPTTTSHADLARLPITLDLHQISIIEGLRAALAVAIIMAASAIIDWPPLRQAALAALLTCICDPGGPIRRRLPVLLGFTLLGAAITTSFGLLRGLGPPVALPLGVFALFCTSFARIYGQAPQQLGGLLGVVAILSLDRSIDLSTSGTLALAFIGGGLWATLLTLVVWRLHPYLPARRAVAAAYDALAKLVADLLGLLRTNSTDTTAWDTHARSQRRAVRDAIEAARDIMLDTLRARGAASPRGTQNLIRLETADQIFGALIALSDLLEHADPARRQAALPLVRRLRPLLTVLGQVVVSDDPLSYRQVGRSIDALTADSAALATDDPLRGIIDRVVERLRIAQTLAVPANFLPGASDRGARITLRDRLLQPVRANLSWQSPALRHAFRIALVAAPALAFSMLWFTPYDHWLTITIVATMQPYFALTYARAIERVLGTALGGLAAAVVGLICTTPLAMAMAMFPLAIAALAVRSVSLGLFMTALTPLIVLLVEVGAPGTSNWLIAGARAGFTLAGGTIAVAANLWLWPSHLPAQLAQQARDAIGAHGRYVETELALLLDDGTPHAVDVARRAAGVSTNTLEASITLALNQPSAADRTRLESVLVIDAALRRLAGRLSAIQLDPGQLRTMTPSALTEWRTWVIDAMRALAAGTTALPTRPASAAGDAVTRLARQIELMAGALARAAA